MDGWIDIIRREAEHAATRSNYKATLVATSYNPKGHLVKGIIVPHGIETGWVPIACSHIGNGFGILVGPTIGSADKLDGDQFDLEFENGDPNTPVARHRLFSDLNVPPEVQSGEILIMHTKGHKLFFAQDGSVTLLHAAANGEIAFDANGNLNVDSKTKAMTVQASSGGAVTVNGSGGGAVSISASGGGAVTLSAGNNQPINLSASSIALTGNVTISGTLNGNAV